MKKDLHPTDYRPVVFQDDAAGFAFLTQSTAKTNDTIKWEDGNEYPLVKLHISSASHPFFTGEEKIIDTEVASTDLKLDQLLPKSARKPWQTKPRKLLLAKPPRLKKPHQPKLQKQHLKKSNLFTDKNRL